MWIYTGDGAFFPGVPMRDLDDDEGAKAAELIEGWPGTLYEHAGDRSARARARVEEQATEQPAGTEA